MKKMSGFWLLFSITLVVVLILSFFHLSNARAQTVIFTSLCEICGAEVPYSGGLTINASAAAFVPYQDPELLKTYLPGILVCGKCKAKYQDGFSKAMKKAYDSWLSAAKKSEDPWSRIKALEDKLQELENSLKAQSPGFVNKNDLILKLNSRGEIVWDKLNPGE